jgi:hypothetical protein
VTEFSTINRCAVLLVPTEVCLAWINSCPTERPVTLAEAQSEPTVYLIPEAKTAAEATVHRHYKAMFEQELNSWYTDPDLWPKDRSFRAFKKFFTIQVTTIVFDMGKGMILRDDEEY